MDQVASSFYSAILNMLLCLRLPSLSKGGSDGCNLLRHLIQIKELPRKEEAISSVSANQARSRLSFKNN